MRHSEGNGSTSGELDDRLGVKYTLLVDKKTRKPRLVFRTDSGDGRIGETIK